MARLLALCVLLVLAAACGGGGKNPALETCGAGGVCPEGYVCNAPDGLCYQRGANHCPVLAGPVIVEGATPQPDAAPIQCNPLPYCCDDMVFPDGGRFNECDSRGGACQQLTSDCPFGCYPVQT